MKFTRSCCCLLSIAVLFTTAAAWAPAISNRLQSTAALAVSSSSWLTYDQAPNSITAAKIAMLQIGAAMDRGQAYNPTSGAYYSGKMKAATDFIEKFINLHGKTPTSLADVEGEWELVFSTVPHGIFRSSPFFLAIQEAYEVYAKEKQSFGMSKADLFFKLHELQTCSWGASKIGRVAQTIIVEDGNNKGSLYSEFDTSLFSLTVIPILGWFKLLPTFGGCVITKATTELEEDGRLSMVVDYTTAQKVPGLNGLGNWIWNIKVPVGMIWKLLPWNKGRPATCSIWVRYVDDDFRIVQDVSGDYFVYTRPVIPRPLSLVIAKDSALNVTGSITPSTSD
jgi:hypothetical protein